MISLKLLYLLLCCILAQAQNCQNVYLVQYSSCVFYFNQSASCNFVSCSWQACNDYYCSTSISLNTTNWTTCTQTCCDTSIQYPQNSNSVQQCQYYVNQQHQKTSLLVGILFGVVGFLIALLLCLYCYCTTGGIDNCFRKVSACLCYFFTCKCFGNSSEIENQQANFPPSMASQQIIRISSSNISQNVLIKNWVNVQVQKDRLFNNCSICYESKPIVELECGHIFHYLCILEWTTRKTNCPECRSSQIQNVQIYCRECLQSYFETKLHQILRHKIVLEELCEKCKVKGQK